MIEQYFEFQFKRLIRMIKESGFPVFMVILSLCALPFALIYVFALYTWLPFVWVFFSLAPLLRLSSVQRNRFLKKLYNREFRKLRLFENLAVALPFALGLLLSSNPCSAFFPFVIAVPLAFFNFKLPLAFVLPTPFSKTPFEFMIGWRKGWYAYFIVLLALAMAWTLDNVNFAFFAQGIAMFLAMANYFEPEPKYYIWINRCTPKQFLFKKILRGLLQAQYVGFLVLICFVLLFPKLALVAFFIQLVASIYLVALILAKYVAYPREMSFPEASELAIAMWFPPFLFYLIPSWFKKSCQNLQNLLK